MQHTTPAHMLGGSYMGPVCARVSLRGATLTTGFVKEGLEVLSPKEILKNYLRTQLSCTKIGRLTRREKALSARAARAS